MFSLFTRPAPAPPINPEETALPSFELPARRALFHYSDGITRRVIDPLVALRKLHASGANLEEDSKRSQDGDGEAIEVLARAVRDVFGVKPYHEFDNPDTGDTTTEGLTDGECLGLLTTFSDYLDALKKNTESPPTLPEPTEQEF